MVFLVEAVLLSETQLLSNELYELLRKIDPASFNLEFEPEAKARLEKVTSKLQKLLAHPSTQPALPLTERIHAVWSAIDHATSTHSQTTTTQTQGVFWTAFQREVHPAYESLASSLRKHHVSAPSLRPTNYARNIFHVASAGLAVAILAIAPSRIWVVVPAFLFFGFAWTAETVRRFSKDANDRLMRFFGPVAHAHERYKVNSATWYSTALMGLALFCNPLISAAAVAVLGLADPAAAIVGRRFGKTPLRASRSLEGSLAFFLTAFASALATFSLLSPTALPWSGRLVASLVAAIVGTLTELYSSPIDDNLSIPVSVAGSVTIAFYLLGM